MVGGQRAPVPFPCHGHWFSLGAPQRWGRLFPTLGCRSASGDDVEPLCAMDDVESRGLYCPVLKRSAEQRRGPISASKTCSSLTEASRRCTSATALGPPRPRSRRLRVVSNFNPVPGAATTLVDDWRVSKAALRHIELGSLPRVQPARFALRAAGLGLARRTQIDTPVRESAVDISVAPGCSQWRLSEQRVLLARPVVGRVILRSGPR
jgi:hypothetical protein